jgi:hypothetical protein
MKYRFATQRQNYEDYAGGRVLYGRPGDTAFPVRLASEIFQRCAERLDRKGVPPPYSLYDPCCGAAYLLTVLGLLHGDRLARILASDVDAEAVERTRRNLALLTPAGLERRLTEIRAMIEQFGKESHAGALESGQRLHALLTYAPREIETACFRFDLAGTEKLPGEARRIDLVLSDLPYGRSAAWQGFADPAQAVPTLLSRIRPALSPASVVALITRKDRGVAHPAYQCTERLTVGHRRVSILEPVDQ